MKVKLFAVLASLIASATLPAAVPLRWTVETSRATPAQFEAYQGETLALEAALQSYGKPLEAPSNYSLYWQTNGMGNSWWEVKVKGEGEQRNDSSAVHLDPSPSPTNVMFATWSPTNDVGAKVYNCFIGQPGTIYHAAFQLRLRPSPGATPNELPLPQKVIDFAKVTVLNPPWQGGGGVSPPDTNAVIDIIRKTVDGSARPLPKYLHALDFCDPYPEASEEYYRSRGNGRTEGGCSSVRDCGYLYRNFDYPFDDRAEFVVRMSAGPGRFASVGVAQVGTNLTEQIVTSGKPSRCYKWLPGATVDGINENGVACNINVVGGEPSWRGGGSPALHPLAAVRWILDNATNAQHASAYIASHVAFPSGWMQNFHYMIADERETWIVENGRAYQTNSPAVMTNFAIYDSLHLGDGIERYSILSDGANITNVWYTRAYSPTDYPWFSDLGTNYESIWERWAEKPREAHRGESSGGKTWWQTVHTSVYDITNRVLRVAVQETDDWYTFAVPPAGGVKPEAVREIVTPMINGAMDEMEATGTYREIVRGEKLPSGKYSIDVEHVDSATRAGWSDFSGTADEALLVYWAAIEDKPNTLSGYGITDARGREDNTCHKTEFTLWTVTKDGVEVTPTRQPIYANEGWGFDAWIVYDESGNSLPLTSYTDENETRLEWDEVNPYEVHYVATRTAVCTDGEKFVTSDIVDGKVSAAVSTNNPEFVSAVRSVSPPPSPNLRLYDEVRQCWWIGRMVNGIINWEVE